MMNDILLKLNRHFYIVVFLAASAFFYALLYVFNVQTDIQKHVDFALALLRGENIPATFLYSAAVCAVGLFRDDYQAMLLASLVVLSVTVAWKFQITARLLAQELQASVDLSENGIYLISNLIGVCLITALCIYLPKELGLTEYFLLGQIPPNIWHNSTTIFLMPLALLLYWRSYKLLEKFEMKEFWLVLGLIFLNILTKPSFFMCFVVVYPLVALIRYGLRREFFPHLIPPFFGGVLLILQYVAVYQLGAYGYGAAGESAVAIAPFAWWRMFAKNVFVSFVLSAAFPLAYLIFHFRRVASRTFIYYAYLLFAFGVVILIFLSETGVRASHGNFQWSAIVCNYILFFAVALDFARHLLQERRLSAKDAIIAALFALHVVSGWMYLFKTLVRGNYG